MGVEDLLQKHSLLEADINVVGERVRSVNSQAEKFVEGDFPEAGGSHCCIALDSACIFFRMAQYFNSL